MAFFKNQPKPKPKPQPKIQRITIAMDFKEIHSNYDENIGADVMGEYLADAESPRKQLKREDSDLDLGPTDEDAYAKPSPDDKYTVLMGLYSKLVKLEEKVVVEQVQAKHLLGFKNYEKYESIKDAAKKQYEAVLNADDKNHPFGIADHKAINTLSEAQVSLLRENAELANTGLLIVKLDLTFDGKPDGSHCVIYTSSEPMQLQLLKVFAHQKDVSIVAFNFEESKKLNLSTFLANIGALYLDQKTSSQDLKTPQRPNIQSPKPQG